ncbi:SseB family protein [Brachybacterium sp. EF45031]|uniref:SseB family protein n=1 Tax=Brachybacterium sillae TaxID=2810536 RepID=UPI00217CEC7F|nr:SseB family protein [Brachybacterium sillae]MCS6711116.1 SseB family protein [Brachybacterium sillae]
MTPTPPPDPDGAGAGHRTLPAHFREKSPLTDTAGVPWKGRDYTVSPFPEDDGSAPAELADALAAHAAGEDPERDRLVAALARSRVLVPIMAVGAGETISAHGLTSDNGADMAMVTVRGADGSQALPVFSSVQALAAWRTDARPVPVVAPQAAQAAVQEGCTVLLLDPGLEVAPVVLPRSVLWALAQGRDWVPPHRDPELRAELDRIAADAPGVVALEPRAGAQREVELVTHLVSGLDREGMRQVVDGLTARLGRSPLVAERISSLALTLRG